MGSKRRLRKSLSRKPITEKDRYSAMMIFITGVKEALIEKGILTNEEITIAITKITNPGYQRGSFRPKSDDSTPPSDLRGVPVQQELPFEQGERDSEERECEPDNPTTLIA